MKTTKQTKDKRKTIVRIVCVVLCVVMLIPLVVNALVGVVSAKSSSEIRKELDALKGEAGEIEAEGQALEKELNANKTETQSTIDEKVAIDMRISLTEAEIQNTNSQIQQYGLLIAEKQSELEDAEAELQAMNEKYKARIRAMEEAGKVSYWSILFKANSFSDLLSRIDSIHEVAEADKRMLSEMEAMAASIQADRQELEHEMAEQKAAKDELAEMEKTLEQQRQKADELIVALSEEAGALSEAYLAKEEEADALRQQILAAQKEYEKALSREEAERLAEQNKHNAAGGSGGSVSGSGSAGSSGGAASGFTAPLPAMTVTCPYGWRTHPIYGDRRYHSGTDLGAAAGTPIKAIAAGTVTSASYSNAYGYHVSISHGNGYGSMYGHMTNYIVSAGQYVSQGQVIGYVGSTGWSTGPHLHLEMYLNGATVNPMDYVG